MYSFDLVKVNASMVRAVRLCVAVRGDLGKDVVEQSQFMDLEREIRDVAGECQRVVELIRADFDRPVISG